MCPKCNHMNFYDKDDDFSTKCSTCNIEMVCVEEKWTSTEEEEKREKIRNSSIVSTPTVTCPYCHSTNTKKITTTSKVVNTAMFGIFGQKRRYQWHCNNCKSDF